MYPKNVPFVRASILALGHSRPDCALEALHMNPQAYPDDYQGRCDALHENVNKARKFGGDTNDVPGPE
jgi:hypothetical protein